MCDRSIALAVETAVAVREDATRKMEAWADGCAGARPEVNQEFRNEKRLVTELAAVAAAAAVNSVPDVLARIESARAGGASQEQILAALAIAASIRGTAIQKVEAALSEPASKASGCSETAAAGAPETGDGKTKCGCSR
jgi:alkylhydroperoxidase/carboxymuconolactone decarboxylase family protein YurZ